MHKQSLNTKGFGLTGVLAVVLVLVVVVVGGGGALIYHKNRNAKAPLSTSTSTNTPSKTSSTTSTSNKTATPQGTYLDLTQEGVKFLLTSSVSDATYAPYVSPITGATAYGLSTQKLENAGGGNNCTAAYGPLGTITVSTTAPSQPAADANITKTPDNKTLFLINGKYYNYQAPQDTAMCSAFTSTEVRVYQQAIAQSFESLQADN